MKDGKPKYIPTRGMLNVRILAGVYLLYLVWQMNKGLPASTGADFGISIAAMGAFLIIGILLIVLSVRALKTGRYAGGAQDNGVSAAAETMETAESSAEAAGDELKQ